MAGMGIDAISGILGDKADDLLGQQHLGRAGRRDERLVTDGRQGVNYRAGTWHAIQSVLEREGEFLVVDRGGDGNNCDEYPLSLCVHVAP